MKQNTVARASDAENATGIQLSKTNDERFLVVAMKPQEEETEKDKTQQVEELKPAEQLPIETAKPLLTIEEIKRKNEVLRRLTAKYDALQGKRERVENFEISHDQDTASVTVSDATGEVFESNSPKTIGKLIEFWKDEFNTAISEIEKEIRMNA